MQFNQDNIKGKTIFVSIIYLNPEGKLLDKLQNCGRVINADERMIEYELFESEERFTIPAFYDNLEEADPELVYRFDETGKSQHIDLVATFTVIPQNDEEEVENG